MHAHCSYDYAVIRIVPRVEREEFVNAGVIVWWARQTPPTSDMERWSGFPHEIGCTVDKKAGDAPKSARAQQVTLTHPGGQRVKLSVRFVAPPAFGGQPYWISLLGRVKSAIEIGFGCMGQHAKTFTGCRIHYQFMFTMVFGRPFAANEKFQFWVALRHFSLPHYMV